MEENICSVSDINAYIKRKLNDDSNLMEVHIRGEISNSKTYANGHSYFTLKDKKSQIPAAFFKGRKYRSKIKIPKNGMKVIAHGNIDIYVPHGKYQLIVDSIEDDGIWVYGSPWSGKTPCYKSERRKVGAFVQLFQAPANSISPCRPSKAYIYIFSSSSGLKFLETVCDQLYDIVAEIIKKVGVYELQCLPNEEAAQLCAQTCLS